MADIVEGLNIAAKTYQTASSLFDDIYSRVENIRSKKLSHNNLLRAYYLEVVNNIELLSIIDFKKFKKEMPNSEFLKSLLEKIDIQIGATILFETEIENQSELYHFLEYKGKINNTQKLLVKVKNGKEQNVREKNFYENILQAISFTVIKTQILRRISLFSDTELEMLKSIMLEKRILNIYERFVMIKIKLEEMKAIKSIAR